MKTEAWEEVISPMLMVRDGWALFIGTPKGINLFSDLYERAGLNEDWYRRTWTCYETGALTAEAIAEQKATMSESRFAREMLCDFTAQSEDQLISLSLATEATQRSFRHDDPVVLRSPLVIGVDPARFGDDRSVIIRRQGLYVFPPLCFKGVDTMWLASRVAMEINQHKPAAVFVDEGGIGAGVIDRLRQLHHTVLGVQFGAKSLTAGFMNRRAEMWWKMKLWLESGGAIPNDPVLVQELATPTYGFNGRGEVVLESKDDIRERLPGRGSPDIADALCLTHAAEVAPVLNLLEERERPLLGGGQRRYDPFDLRTHYGRNPFKPR
jgi:hypothetical protein